MRVRCSAPECGAVFEVPDDQAGQTVLCPECGASVGVPGAGGEDHFDDIKAAAGEEGKVLHPARQQCPNCGAMLGVRAAICPQCGADIRTGAVAAVARRRIFDWRPFAIGGGIAVGLLVLIVMIVVVVNLTKERAKKVAETAAREAAEKAEAAAVAAPAQTQPTEVVPHVELTEADLGTLPQQEADIAQAVATYKTRLNDALSQIGKADAATAADLWADLAAFCKENGLLTESDMCWIRAARLAPRNAAVNAKLGRTETVSGYPVTPEQKQFLDNLRPRITVANRSAQLPGYSVTVAGQPPVPLGWADRPQVRADAGDLMIELVPPAGSEEGRRSLALTAQDGLQYTVVFCDASAAPMLAFASMANIFNALTGSGDAGNAAVERNGQGEVVAIEAGDISAGSTTGAPLSMQMSSGGTLLATGLLTSRETGPNATVHTFWGGKESPLRLRVNSEAQTVEVLSGTYARVTSTLSDGLMGVLATAEGDAANLWIRRQLSQKANQLATAEVDKEARGETAAPWRAQEASYEQMSQLQADLTREARYWDRAYARPPGVDCARAVGMEDRVSHLYLNWPRFRNALASLTGGCADAILEMIGPQQAPGQAPEEGPARRGRPRDVTDMQRTDDAGPGGPSFGARRTSRTTSTPLAPPGLTLDEATRKYALMRVLAVLPDDKALSYARSYWRSVDYEGKVAALVSLETVGSDAVVSFLGELSREETDVDVIAAALLSLGNIGTPEALRHCQTPGVAAEVRTASMVARAIAGDPEVLPNMPDTLAKAGDRGRQMILDYVAQADSPATLVVLSAAIDAIADKKAHEQIAAALVRIGGRAAMTELARLMQTDETLYPNLLGAVAPEDAAPLIRLIGTAVADGKGTEETVAFLMEKGGPAGRAYLRAAAVNRGSAPVLTALLREGSLDAIQILTESAHMVDLSLLAEVRKRWYTVGLKPGQWAWQQAVDTRAAKEFLGKVFEKGKTPKVRICAAWMMTEVGERPDTQRLLALTDVQPEKLEAPGRQPRRGGAARRDADGPPADFRRDEGAPPGFEPAARPTGTYSPPNYSEPAGEPLMPTDFQLPGKPQLYALGLLEELGAEADAGALREKLAACTDDQVRTAMMLTIGSIGGPADIEFLRTGASVRAESYASAAEVGEEMRGRLIALSALAVARDSDSLPKLLEILRENPPPNEAITDVADYDSLSAWWRVRLYQEVCQTIVSICTEKQLFDLTGDGELQRQMTERLLDLIERTPGGSTLGNMRDVLRAKAVRAYARCASPYDSGTLLVLKRIALIVPGQQTATASRAPARGGDEVSRSARSRTRGTAARAQQQTQRRTESLADALQDAVVCIALHGGGMNILGEVSGVLPRQIPDQGWSQLVSDMAISPPPQYFNLVNMAPEALTDGCRQTILDETLGQASMSDPGYALFVAGMIRRPVVGEGPSKDETQVETQRSTEEIAALSAMPEEVRLQLEEQERLDAEERARSMAGEGVRYGVRPREEETRKQKDYVRHGSRRKIPWAYSVEATGDVVQTLRRKWAVVELLFECDPMAVAVAVQQAELYNHRDFGPEIAVRYAALSNAARDRALQAMRSVLVGETETIDAVTAGPGFVGRRTVTQSSAEAKRAAALTLRRIGGEQAATTLYDALVGTVVEQSMPNRMPDQAPAYIRDMERGVPEDIPTRVGDRYAPMRRGTSGPDAGSLWVARALGGLGRADLLRNALNARGRTSFDRDSAAVQMAALEGMAFLPDQVQAVDLLRGLLGLASTPELREAVGNAIMRALQRTGED